MKKLILIMLVISTSIYAQKPNKGESSDRGPKSEKIKALKVAHISNELDLTSKEAEKFWPIYNEYDNAMMEIRKELRENSKGKFRPDSAENLTDEEANQLIENMLAMKTSELSFQKELVANLKGVIPPTKILKLQHAERTFREKLLKQLKERKPEKKQKKKK